MYMFYAMTLLPPALLRWGLSTSIQAFNLNKNI